jgi:hypothetical protein
MEAISIPANLYSTCCGNFLPVHIESIFKTITGDFGAIGHSYCEACNVFIPYQFGNERARVAGAIIAGASRGG